MCTVRPTCTVHALRYVLPALVRFVVSAQVGLAMVVLVAGCATTQPQVEMEAPGRPAVTWQSEGGGAAPPPKTATKADTERELLAQLHDAEQKASGDLALADTLYNLAILRRQQGALVEAEPLYRRALAIREREQGPNHPDVAVILNNLAGLYAAQSNYTAAQPLLERALTIRQTALGEAHVLTAESLNNLALLYAAQDNAVAAEPLYRRALAILETAGPLPKGTQQTDELERVLDNYTALLRDTGRDVEADKLEARMRLLRASNRSGTSR